MTNDEIRSFIQRTLLEIAPDADFDELGPKDSLRDELDIDSMDFLAFVRAVHDELGVEVKETEYNEIDSLDGATAYLARALADR